MGIPAPVSFCSFLDAQPLSSDMTVQKSSMRGLPSDDKILVTTSLLCFVIQTSSWWDLNTLLSAHVGSDTASLTVAPYLTLILITGPEPTDRWATNDFQDRN